jgi:MFS family permease
MVAVWTLGEILGSAASTAIAADRAPDHARGRYQSALGAVWSVAFAVGPILGTLTYGALPAVLWWSCGALGVASLALALAARRFPVPSHG